jgi:hypothetical protein
MNNAPDFSERILYPQKDIRQRKIKNTYEKKLTTYHRPDQYRSGLRFLLENSIPV